MAVTQKSHSSSHDTKNALSTDDRKHMNESTYAFPKQRKEPLNDASHVRNAIARFDQVKDLTDEEREEGFPQHQGSGQETWCRDDRDQLEAARRQATHFQFSA